jgi:hypothetical protein
MATLAVNGQECGPGALMSIPAAVDRYEAVVTGVLQEHAVHRDQVRLDTGIARALRELEAAVQGDPMAGWLVANADCYYDGRPLQALRACPCSVEAMDTLLSSMYDADDAWILHEPWRMAFMGSVEVGG